MPDITHLFRVRLLAVEADYLGRHEALRAREALGARRQNAPAYRVVGQLQANAICQGNIFNVDLFCFLARKMFLFWLENFLIGTYIVLF